MIHAMDVKGWIIGSVTYTPHRLTRALNNITSPPPGAVEIRTEVSYEKNTLHTSDTSVMMKGQIWKRVIRRCT